MKRLLALLACLLLAAPAFADGIVVPGIPRMGQVDAAFSFPPTVSGGGYVGPGNAISASVKAFWGLQAYNAAYGTGPAAIVCDVATGSTCSTVNFLSNGKFDSATAAALPQCATACDVSQLYDSTGNGLHATQSLNAARPTLTFNCINTSLPCLTFSGTQSLSVPSGIGTIAQPWVIVGVGKRTGNFGNYSSLYGDTSAYGILWINTTNTIAAYASNVANTTASDNAWHIFIGTGNGTSGEMNVDNATTGTVNSGTGSLDGATQAVGSGTFGGMTGQATIWGVYSATISSGNQTTLCHNLYSFWATSTSC